MRKQGYIYAALGAMGWGTTFIATKFAVQAVTPGTFLFFRYFVATIILLLIYRKRPRQKVARKDWPMIIFISVIGYFFAIWCQHAATAVMDASLVSLLFAVTPVSVMLLAMPILKEKPTPSKLLAVLFTVGGALLVIGKAGGGSTPLGLLLALGAILSWSLTSVLIRKTCGHTDVVWLTIYTQIIAAICCLPMLGRQLILGQEALGLGPVGWVHIAAFLWAGVVSTAMANLFWNRALDLVDANTVSLFYAFMPLTTSVLGTLILGEQLGFNFLAGVFVFFAGWAIAAIGNKKSPVGADRYTEPQIPDTTDTERRTPPCD